jgi:mycothiol synthase
VAVARPAGPDDLDGVLALQREWNRRVYGEPRVTRALLAAHWPDAGHWIVAGPAAAVAGYAAVDSGGGLELWARPGGALDEVAAAGVSAAAAHHPGRLETVVPREAGELHAALERLGFELVREVLEMAVELRPPLADPGWPAGLHLRPFDAERDAADVHACLVEAFRASDERVAPYDEWRPWVLGDPMYDPALVFVADGDGEVAGVAQCWTDGFVKDLAVRPAYRGRGLGEALLRTAFAEFARRGVEHARLKVDSDNPTGAVRLYRRVGMEEIRRDALYARG